VLNKICDDNELPTGHQSALSVQSFPCGSNYGIERGAKIANIFQLSNNKAKKNKVNGMTIYISWLSVNKTGQSFTCLNLISQTRMQAK
jgi:hypothetical protein